MASNNLPEDMMIEILSRLPAKLLMQFKCVCKSWNALIKNPDFITKHLLQNKKNADNIIIKRSPIRKHKPIISLLSCNETLDDVLQVDLLDVPFNKQTNNDTLILGPCNGILLLIANPFILLNPALQEYKELQISDVPCPPNSRIIWDHLGFGFDPKTNDYKVVRIMVLWDEERDVSIEIPQVEVYTLSTDSWKKLDLVVPANISANTQINTYLSGVYYWWGTDSNIIIDREFDDKMDYQVILSFDFGNEVFQNTQIPNLEFSWKETFGTLALWNECVALILYPYKKVEKYFDIWVLNEYGVKESLTKVLTIGPLVGVERPLGFWKNGELFLESTNQQLVLYDPISQGIKNLLVEGYPETFQVIMYTESLVSLNENNGVKNQKKSFNMVLDPFFVHK